MANQHRNFLRSSVIFVAVFVAYECCFGTTFTGTHTRSTPPGRARNCASALKRSAVGVSEMFEDFTNFLRMKQEVIIGELESIENEEHRFTRDPWGCFLEEKNKSGGLTRVLQGGTVIEKGACSFTVIRGGLLSAERAKSISARQGGDLLVQAGDAYAAAALSIVLHTRSPKIPTFRSDVRIFWVQSANGQEQAWLGGGADLTPYYLDKDDIGFFHQTYKTLCSQHLQEHPSFTYASMKEACDAYFYLPARQEHRGTGGIFFDDLPVDEDSLNFVKQVVTSWMPSWKPIVTKHVNEEYTEEEKHWQLVRRGRYLEFNLLYDRGVKFGLANVNPRVEGFFSRLNSTQPNHQLTETETLHGMFNPSQVNLAADPEFFNDIHADVEQELTTKVMAGQPNSTPKLPRVPQVWCCDSSLCRSGKQQG
eukprot:symbB.v1.2.038716.t1/scaffold6138.1/size20662/3